MAPITNPFRRQNVLLRLFALTACVSCVLAQDYRAKVQGLVTDSSDALAPGSKVTLTNNGTGIASSREAGPNGAYLFDNVEPGVYTLTAELPGFARQTHENVLVQTRADVTVNFTLRPGGTAETINVTATSVSLQFNSSTRELT